MSEAARILNRRRDRITAKIEELKRELVGEGEKTGLRDGDYFVEPNRQFPIKHITRAPSYWTTLCGRKCKDWNGIISSGSRVCKQCLKKST